MFRFLIFGLIIFYNYSNLQAQSVVIKDTLRLPDFILHELNRPYTEVIYINDCNQLLMSELLRKRGCSSNDTWYTLGIEMNGGIPLKKSNKFLSLSLRSDLYTEEVGEPYRENGRKITQEIFTEINELGIGVRPYNLNAKRFFSWDISTGVINRDRVFKYSALWFQAGKDGRGGYHLLFDQNGKDNISRNELKGFLKINPKINKLLVLSPNEKRAAWATGYVGMNLSNIKAMNTLETGCRLNLPLTRSGKYNSFNTNFLLGGQSSLHFSGISVRPEIALQIIFFQRFEIEAMTVIPWGNNNIGLHLVKDDPEVEPLLRGTLKYKFNKSGN